ncbi:MAG: HAD family hydrolase [Phycisphaerales bacterium]|nr:HAD family hydrolase [Phycisphaerales bacterium]
MQSAVFLDRDDTIIVNGGDLGDPAGVRLAEGAAEALKSLHKAGFALIVVTNQAGVGRGAFTESDIPRVHARIAQLLAEALQTPMTPSPTIGPDGTFEADAGHRHSSPPLIAAYYYCPYHPDASVERYRAAHPWRKPAPGMLFAAAAKFGIDLGRSWMIGDAERDAEAGSAAGCRTIRLGSPDLRSESSADFIEPDMKHAAARIEFLASTDDRPRTSVLLRALAGARLDDPAAGLNDEAAKSMIKSNATGIAERAGVTLESITISRSCVRATLIGESIVGVVFAAELRRTTEQWYRGKFGGSLWGGS